MRQKIALLQAQREEHKLLFIEDNEGLRHNVQQLVQKFFQETYMARDGIEGIALFKKHQPQIVITDINLPRMNGLQLAEQVRSLNPRAKVIIMSAYDDKEYLFEAIRNNVFRYISKPAKVAKIIDVLYETKSALKAEEERSFFQNQLEEIFHYQNHLVVMLSDDLPVLANQRFYDFFGSDDLPASFEKLKALRSVSSDLREIPDTEWFAHARRFPGKPFHTKMANEKGEQRHLVLKLQTLPDREHCSILTLEDITDLNLLTVTPRRPAKQGEDTLLHKMQRIHERAEEIKLHSFYKGLAITNPATFVAVGESIVLKTAFIQLKAAHHAKQLIISSEALPYDIVCDMPDRIAFDEETITLSNLRVAENSPTRRQYIRLEPEPHHTVMLSCRGVELNEEIRIIDLSERSARVEISVLPVCLKSEEYVQLSLRLPGGRGVALSVNAQIFRIDEGEEAHHLVLMYHLQDAQRTQLRNYLSTRQMALIREFRSLDVKTE